MSGFATVSKDVTSSSLIGLLFVRRYPDMPCAADVVNTLDQQALASILTAYGEERHARKIASAIVEARRVNPITRTQQLAGVVAGSSTLSWLIPRSILEAVRQNKTRVELLRLSPGGTYLSKLRGLWPQSPSSLLPLFWVSFFHTTFLWEIKLRQSWRWLEQNVANALKTNSISHTVSHLSLLPHCFLFSPHFPRFSAHTHLTQMQTPTYAHTHDTLVHEVGNALFVFTDGFLFFFFFASRFELLNEWDVVSIVIAQSSMCVSVTLGEQVWVRAAV